MPQHIEKDAAFERRFQQVMVNEPSVPEAISILRGIKEKYEVHHGVTILDASLVAAATLAHRYLTSRKLVCLPFFLLLSPTIRDH